MGDTQKLERKLRGSAGLILILLWLSACAAPGPTTPGAKANAPGGSAQQEGTKADGPGKVSKAADQILSISVEDGVKESVIRLTGNGTFQDYQFQRMGEGQFTLDIGDVHSKADVQGGPASSSQVSLSIEDAKPAGQGIRLVGSLNKPLDRYFINNQGSELTLVLYLSDQPLSVAKKDEAAALPTAAPHKKGKSSARSSAAPSPKPSAAPTPSLSASAQDARPAAIQQPDSTDGLIRKTFTGKPISLDLLDADLRNVLRLLADVTGTNIVIEPEVTGKVTLKVEHVPWDQVLDMVLSMNELGKEQVGNVIRIAKQSKLKAEWSQAAEQIRAKQELLEAAKDMGEITTVYLTVNYAQPAEIAAKINEIKSDKGKISIDERTSLILYSDYPARLENARSLLARLDKATSQVLIEARIVRLSTTARNSLGVQWSFNYESTKGNAKYTSDFHVNHPVSGDTFHFNYGNFLAPLNKLDMTLSALEVASQGKILSAPKVLTVNNVKAVITQGTQIPYIAANQASPVGSTGQTASTEFRSAVLELQVTPHITPDRKVRLEINAKQDAPSGQVVQNQPVLDTRSITTELMVDDGSTVVIGGVIQDDESTSMSGTPGLNKIPLLGWLFKKNEVRRDKSEMLIFISPKIIDGTTYSFGG